MGSEVAPHQRDAMEIVPYDEEYSEFSFAEKELNLIKCQDIFFFWWWMFKGVYRCI